MSDLLIIFIFIAVIALFGGGIVYYLRKIYMELSHIGFSLYEHYDRVHQGWMECSDGHDDVCKECRDKEAN